MNSIEPKNYNFSNVKYFSPMQLSEHYVLYTRYVDCINRVNKSLLSNSIYSICNPNYSDVRSAVKSKTFCFDAVKLHELYFENLTGNSNFLDKFECIALSMHGWVLFCYDRYSKDFYIYGQDSHDEGVMLFAEPLIVLDVYEHAYMIDYGINRKDYVEAFISNLDFGVVNKRLRNLNL